MSIPNSYSDIPNVAAGDFITAEQENLQTAAINAIEDVLTLNPPKAPVRLATAAPLSACSFASDELTADAAGALSIDGISAAVGDRVLVKNQATGQHNGLYAVTSDGSSTVWKLTRASDMTVSSQVPGAIVYVREGTANAGRLFGVAGATSSFTLNTTSMTWSDVILSSMQTSLGAKQPLDADLSALAALTGTGLAARTAADTWAMRSVQGTTNRVSVSNGDGVSGNPAIDIDGSYAGQASITTVGTIGAGAWQGSAVAVAFGGTGAANAANARTNLGLTIGSDVQAYDADLAAFAGLSSTGLVARTGAGQVSARTITGTANQVNVSNGDGVSGNPTMSLPQSIATTSNVQFGKVQAGSVAPQSTSLLSARNSGNNLEFGHGNLAGYGSTIGSQAGNGYPFLAFCAEAGTTANTYRTRGIKGSVMRGNLDGGFLWDTLGAASSDDQTPTSIMTLSSAGALSAAKLGLGVAAPASGILHAAGTDIATIALVSGVSKGVRIGASATHGIVQAVDNTGVASHQPLLLGGSEINFHVSSAEEMRLTSAALSPAANDGTALGTSSLMWSDLFLADGAVINFNNGNVSLTHSSGTLTLSGATSGLKLSSTTSQNLFAEINSASTLAFSIYATNVGAGNTELWFNRSSKASTPVKFFRAGTTGVDLLLDASGNVQVGGPSVSPATTDTAALGTASLMWSDLFLASGAVVNFDNGDVTVTHSANTLTFGGASSYKFDAAIVPSSSDGAALGSAALQFSDLFLAEGGVINWDNGDITLTQSGNTLAADGLRIFAVTDTNDTGPVTLSITNGSTAATTPSAQFLLNGGGVSDNFSLQYIGKNDASLGGAAIARNIATVGTAELRLQQDGTRPVTFYTNGSLRATIRGSDGNLGLSGITDPDNPLDILVADNGNAAIHVTVNATTANVTGSDYFAAFSSTSGVIGSITGTATPGLIAYNTFTGSHWAQGDIDKRTVERSRTRITRRVHEDGTAYDESQVTRFPVWISDLEPGTVLVSTNELCDWGVNDPNFTLPRVAVSFQPMDKAVYGVYGGHDREGDILVLALGSGVILVTDEGGPIEVGDFLCTSSTPGRAMRYDGENMRVVVAKARQAHASGSGKIACTYLAG